MIEARNLMKIYKPKKGVPVHALNNVSVKLPDKGMVFILGKSGSGKSTLLNVLGGLDNIDSGEIVIKGVSAKDFKQAHYDSYRNTYVGFIFQEYNVLEEFTVGANVALAIELQGRKPTNEEINKILKEVDLDGYGNRKPNELSGGQKQRVAIARALVKNPEIIMADEPTGALDSVTGRQVFDTLKSLSKDKLVLIVSHDREFSELYADRIIELADGEIISDVEKVNDYTPAPVVDEKPLTYSGNEIEIKKGYVLTQADLDAINKYIANLSDDAKMVIKGELHPEHAQIIKGEFKATDESKIVIEKDNSFKLIKSKLSLKNAFKIGASGLKHKKFRLVFTIFLSFIAFALFGLADTIAAYDNVGTAINSLIDSNIDYASFEKKIDGYSNNYLLSDADISSIKQNSGINVTGVYKEINYDIRFDRHLVTDDVLVEKKLETLLVDKFTGFAEVTKSDLDRYGYTLIGEMPRQGKKEIAISKYVYESFVEAGFTYMNAQHEEITKDINSPQDVIGMVIKFDRYGDYTITGVIDTKFDYTRYNALLEDSIDTAQVIINMALRNELETTQRYSMNCVAFVAPGTIASIRNSISEIGQEFWSFANMSITNRPKDYNGDDWDKFQSIHIQRIARLKDISMPIAWIGSEKTSLENGEFIVPVNMLSEISIGGYVDWWSSDTLKGYEKTLYELGNSSDGEKLPWTVRIYSLINAIDYHEYIAAYRYASEMEIGDATFNHIKSFLMNDVEGYYYDEYSFVSWSDKDTIVNTYVELCKQDPANAARAKSYLNDLVSRYKLEGQLIDLREAGLYVSITYNGYENQSSSPIITRNNFLSGYQSIIMNHYAFSHFEDAKDYYLENHPNAVFTVAEAYGDKVFADFYNIINEYMDQYYTELGNGNKVLNDEMSEYAFNKFAPLVIDSFSLDGMKVRIDIHNSDEELEYDFKLVGIADLRGNANFGIISDELCNKMLGGNADGLYAFAVAPMPSSRADIENVVKFSYKEFDGDVTFGLANSVTFELDMIDELLDILGQVFLYVGLALAVFASLMLSNFIATSISLKKQEIGILRAIGSRSNDVFRIFFAEAFIIAMINFVLAIVTTGIVATVLNSILREDVGILITILSFGIRQIGLLFLVSLAVAFLSTFFPVKKIASKKPIDAIRKR